jgi:hypothetical protein
LWPNPIIGHDVEILKGRTANNEATVRITKAIEGVAKKGNSQEQSSHAITFRRFTMATPKDQLTTLMNNDQYAEPVFSKFQELKGTKDEKLYFVTDIITCGDMAVSDQRESVLDVNVNLTIPAGAMAGMDPGTSMADVQLGAGVKRTTKQGKKGTYDGEVIVALGYYAMELVEPPKRTLFQRFRGLFSKPKLGNVRLVAPMNPSSGIYFAKNQIEGDYTTLGDDDSSDGRSDDDTHKDPILEEGNCDFNFKLYVQGFFLSVMGPLHHRHNAVYAIRS